MLANIPCAISKSRLALRAPQAKHLHELRGDQVVVGRQRHNGVLRDVRWPQHELVPVEPARPRVGASAQQTMTPATIRPKALRRPYSGDCCVTRFLCTRGSMNCTSHAWAGNLATAGFISGMHTRKTICNI